MPISRYEIRNEYSLADPDLYRAADKDDPEALLEGVAMAGLVGVLRQLGDLAEFAADVFHNLHEEVMATAARGHGLMTRVQQLEAEVPSIERAFLSQTDHSSIFYHAGADWHPSLHIDQNLVTQGDLPRFIMDSYEECRPPPRLFLLDKFDVAGAGACLKRYTDPSFFKVETSGMIRSDAQREKKIRKAKKKGPRWRNGEIPEVLPTSHTKLHQLFLEDHVGNGVSNPSRRAKLKRRLSGFPFDSRTGKSYMEKLLRSPTPDHKVLHEVTLNSSSLMLSTNVDDESRFEVRPLGPESERVGSKRRPPSPDREEIVLNPSIYEPSEVPLDDKICEVPDSYPSIATNDISPSLDEVSGEKVIAMDTEGNRERSSTGYESDDIASEVDNYVDAPSTIESEMDTDSELRGKSDFTSSRKIDRPLISDASEEHLHIQSPDSQSTRDSTVSDKGNNSSRNEMSSFSSDSPSTSAENQQSEKNCAKGFPSADINESEIVDASSYQKTAGEDFLVDQHSKPAVSDDTFIGTDPYRSDFERSTSSLSSNESIQMSAHSDSEQVGRKGMSMGAESEASNLDDEEKKTDLVNSVFDFQPLSGDGSPGSSAGEHLVDEGNGETVPCISTVPDIDSYSTGSSVKISFDLLHEDESDQEDDNLVENMASTLDTFSQNTNGTPVMISSEGLIPSELGDEFRKLPENFPSGYPDIAHNEDYIKSTVTKGENLTDKLDDEDSNASAESPNHLPLVYFQTEDAVDNQSSSSLDNPIGAENSMLLHPTNSPDWPQSGLDAHEGDAIPKKETILSESIIFGTPNDSEVLESSCTPEDLEHPAGTSGTVEIEAITLCTSSTGREVTEMAGSADLKSMNEVHVLLDDSDSDAPKSDTADMASAMPAISDNVAIDNVHLEEHIHCFDKSGLDEFENDKTSLFGSHGESDLVEKGDQTEAATSAFGIVFCTISNDHPKTEVLETLSNSHLDLEADQDSEVGRAPPTQSLVDQSGLDREQEFFQQSGLGNHVADVPSLQVDYDTEEPIIQEKIGSPRSEPDQQLLQSAEISSELSPLLSVDHQQMLDHDDRKGDNNPASPFSLLDCQSPPSVSEFRNGVSGYPNNPLGSIFHPSNPFSNTNQVDLADLPPLPPLPPVQWRMTKLQHASSSTQGQIMKHKELFPQLFSPPTASTNDFSFTPQTASSNDACFTLQTASSNDVDSPPLTASTGDVGSPSLTTSTDDVDSSSPTVFTDDVSSSPNATTDVGSSPPTTSTDIGSSPLTASTGDVGSSSPITSTGDVGSSPSTASLSDVGSSPSTASIDVGSSPPTVSTGDVGSSPPTASPNDVNSSLKEMKHSLIQIAPETTSKEEKTGSSSEASFMHETIDLPPKIENKHQQFVMPTSQSEIPPPAEEDGVANGSQKVKLPRPRNPLIDDVVALDKSKLRKVTDRVRPQIQKVDERDSLLEQIRTKSFNLKPTMASRPSTRGPNTNLKVAAILEKANAIRHALTGSDEDDDDTWSE